MSAPYWGVSTVEPGRRSGQPTIRGQRATGRTEQEILADCSSPTHEDILVCLAYAADRERRVLITHG
jgi:uncharacterized protein (DUF433 family)